MLFFAKCPETKYFHNLVLSGYFRNLHMKWQWVEDEVQTCSMTENKINVNEN